jgi:hypothetical protein
MRSCVAFVGLCLVLALGVVACGGDDEDIERNKAILAELPTFPGATEYTTESAPYYEEDGADAEVIGHTTTITYEVRPGATAKEVVDFYASHLRAHWRCERGQLGVLLLDCERGSEDVSVNTDNLHAHPPRFDVVADFQGAA